MLVTVRWGEVQISRGVPLQQNRWLRVQFPSPALIEQAPHHAHVITTEGTSMRLAEATAGRRVVPLT